MLDGEVEGLVEEVEEGGVVVLLLLMTAGGKTSPVLKREFLMSPGAGRSGMACAKGRRVLEDLEVIECVNGRLKAAFSAREANIFYESGIGWFSNVDK